MIQQLTNDLELDRIFAVVVTYNSDLRKVDLLLSKLLGQVTGLIVVDNGSSQEVVRWLRSQLISIEYEVVALKQNQGIASAQNIGIRRAQASGSTHVVLFDHDSDPNADMVAKLLSAIKHEEAQGTKVAAAGPRFVDARQKTLPPFVRVEGFRLKTIACTDQGVVKVDYLIASGCLIPMQTLEKVGFMKDDLFIDYVDIEWGLRAKSLGFQSLGVCDAHMGHSLGDTVIQFRGKVHPLHIPTRHYYHFRNAVNLYKRRDLPLNWKVVDSRRLLRQYIFYSIFAKPRFRHWWMMTKGLWHGLLGRSGRLV